MGIGAGQVRGESNGDVLSAIEQLEIVESCARVPDERPHRKDRMDARDLRAEAAHESGKDSRSSAIAGPPRQPAVFVFNPSAAMRDASVVAFMPRSCAAPFGPNTLPLVCSSA